METVKIKDVNNGVVKEVKKSLAADYVGTGRFELVNDKPVATKNNKFDELSEDKKPTTKWKS